MSAKTKAYISFVISVGAVITVNEIFLWESRDLLRYFCYVVLAILCSRLRVILPGIQGALSLSFIFILFGIVQLSLPETVALACLATLAELLCNRRAIAKQRFLFSIGTVALASAAASYAYHSPFLHLSGVDTTVRLAIACIVFFTMSTFPIAAVLAMEDGTSLRKAWYGRYFWSFPYYLAGAGVAGLIGVVDKYLGWQSALLIVPVVYLMYRSVGLYLARVEDERRHAEDMASLHLRTIEALALAIGAKDHTTHDHLKRVQVYAIEIGKTLGLAAAELEALRAAALLHDIGKLAVPEHIISKPGKLTREEFEKMKIHPVVGAEILERVQFPYAVSPIVRAHHEKWDGSGYPDGLKGEEIPIGARILSAVDCLDALASDRQYRRALPLEEAMRRVQREAGVAFDPKVVHVLETRYRELEKIAHARPPQEGALSTGVRVERGSEPAAGLAKEQCGPAASRAADHNFVTSIASARHEMQQLFELAQALGSSLSLNETLSLVAMRIKRLVQYDALAVYVQHGGVLQAEYVNGENFRLFSSLAIPLGQGLSGWVAENRKPILNGNPAVEPGYLDDETKFTTMRSAVAVPLSGPDGRSHVLTLYHSERDAFTSDHLRILLGIAAKLGSSIENALNYEETERSITVDPLTGLPNARALFQHLDGELARSRRQRSPVTVLVYDINGFKQVNDDYGRPAGDKLLRAIAGKLKASCREYDYIARMGADEFVIVMPGLPADQARLKLETTGEIAAGAAAEVFRNATLTLSSGHACYPEDGDDADGLLMEADRRMSLMKRASRPVAADAESDELQNEVALSW